MRRFQWAALHIRELLSFERDSDVLRYLNDLPFGIKGAYDRIYERIESQRGSKRHVAITAMKVLICAQRDLSPAELTIAACQDPDKEFNEDIDIDPTYLLDACQDLIDVQDSGPCIPLFTVVQETRLLRTVLERKSTVVVPPNFSSSSSSSSPQQSENGLPEANEELKSTVDHKLFCRFSHLSVVEYLADKWDINGLHAYVARVCLRTLLRFSVPYTRAEYYEPSLPIDCPITRYWSLHEAYDHFEQTVQWHFHQTIREIEDDIELPDDDPELWPPIDALASSSSYSDSFSYSFYDRDDQKLCDQAPLMWLKYATWSWYQHVALSTEGPPMTPLKHKDALTSLVETFYGHPFHGSSEYRFWITICKLLKNPSEDILKPTLSISREKLIPIFWCAYTGNLGFSASWLEEGVSDSNLQSKTLFESAVAPRSRDSLIKPYSGKFGLREDRATQGFEYTELILRGVLQKPAKGFEAVLGCLLRAGWHHVVLFMLNSGLDINRRYSKGTLLHVAVLEGSLEGVKLIVEKGADVDLRATMRPWNDFYLGASLTPLEASCVCLNDQDGIALYLTSKVSDINFDHPIAIFLAALTGKTFVMRSLVGIGADVDFTLPGVQYGTLLYEGWVLPLAFDHTLLQTIFCQIPDMEVHEYLCRHALKTLLEFGANPNVTDWDGHSLLWASVEKGDYHLTTQLVWHGAYISEKYEDGTTLLQKACRGGHFEIARFLVDNGADVNEVSGPWRTAIYAAYLKIVQETDYCMEVINATDNPLDFGNQPSCVIKPKGVRPVIVSEESTAEETSSRRSYEASSGSDSHKSHVRPYYRKHANASIEDLPRKSNLSFDIDSPDLPRPLSSLRLFHVNQRLSAQSSHSDQALDRDDSRHVEPDYHHFTNGSSPLDSVNPSGVSRSLALSPSFDDDSRPSTSSMAKDGSIAPLYRTVSRNPRFTKPPHNFILSLFRTSMWETLEALAIPANLFHDDEGIAVVPLLIELGAKFRWEDYDELDNGDHKMVKLLELLVRGYKEQMKKQRARRWLGGKLSERCRRSECECSSRMFYGAHDGFVAVCYHASE